MSNLAVQYDNNMRNYENFIDANYKKNNGIFYTDIELASKIIDELNIDLKSTVVDPCCGMGSFLLAAKQKGIRAVFGADIDAGAISECKKHLKSIKVIHADTLGVSADTALKSLKVKKIDFVVGNPPYAPLNSDVAIISEDYLFMRKVTDSGNNLFIAALIRALDMVKAGGIVSYIIPKNFLHVDSYSLLRREILKQKTILSIIDIGIYFKNVRGEQIILTIKNELPADNKVIIKKLINGSFEAMTSIPQDFYSDEVLLFNSSEEFSVYKKLKSSYQMLKDVCTGYVGRGKSTSEDAISGKEIRKFGYKNTMVPKNGNRILIQNIYSAEAGIIAAFGGMLEATQTVTILTDSDEKMCRYILGVLHSRLCNFFLYKFCYNSSSLTMHTDAKYLKKIPLVIKNDDSFEKILIAVHSLELYDYMSDKWFDSLEELNTLVYDAYDINEDEAKFIDCRMKQVQSKRWLKNGE